jgi:hypothetical protein
MDQGLRPFTSDVAPSRLWAERLRVDEVQVEPVWLAELKGRSGKLPLSLHSPLSPRENNNGDARKTLNIIDNELRESLSVLWRSRHSDKPVWDAISRELKYRDQVVKAFKNPADNQVLMLGAFEKQKWWVSKKPHDCFNRGADQSAPTVQCPTY